MPILSLFISLLILVCIIPSAASQSIAVRPEQLQEPIAHHDNNNGRLIRSVRSAVDLSPRRDDFLGERSQAGDTWYDFHANGSTGKMIAIAPNGGVHITWCDGYEEDVLGGERHQKYNYYDPDNEEWMEEDGSTVDFGIDRGGFGCLALTEEDDPRALVFYHGKDDTAWTGFSGIDFEAGLGVFETIFLPQYPQMTAYFAQGVVSPEGKIHVATQRRDRGMIGYAIGELGDDGLPEYDEVVREVGETHRTTLRIASSPHSERVAIIWMMPRAGIPIPEEWNGGPGYIYNNDLMLAWSDDGDEWNFDDPINVTDNIDPDPDLEGDEAYGDTLRPHVTMDLIFDSDDNIHIVFDCRGFWQQPIPEDNPPVDGITSDASFLFHWSEETEEITPVADGWYTHREVDEDGNTVRWPVPGAYKSNVCAPSLAYDEEGDLYCVFSYFPMNDYSEQNYCNGDIAVTVSEDNGETWFYPTMITETRTHLAEVGEAECELYPTVASVVDDFLHISYELDTEPGTPVEDYAEREEIATLCPWFYHKMPLDEIARDSIWDSGPDWHALPPESVDDHHTLTPNDYNLLSVYPNPFNNRTTIEFNTRKAESVSIAVYDLGGREVAELHSGELLRGTHKVEWDAASLTGGVYFVRLTGEGRHSLKKIVLLK